MQIMAVVEPGQGKRRIPGEIDALLRIIKIVQREQSVLRRSGCVEKQECDKKEEGPFGAI
jgi:hypothetical protein